jgi:hypothetical protein
MKDSSRAFDEQKLSRRGLVLSAVALVLSGCGASTSFVSSWKAPDAKPLEFRGSKVAAVVMMSSEPTRRAAEDKLAGEISARGATGVPMYSILPNVNPGDEAQARAALEQANVKGVVVMRPMSVEKQVVVAPSAYSDSMYAGYWNGGYYAHGWGSPYGVSTMNNTYLTTTVSIETLIYSLAQNKLVWGGQSKTADPTSVDALVAEVASAAADELAEQGLVAR